MDIKVDRQDDHITYALSGVVDELGAEKLKGEFQKLDIDSAKEVVIDFSGVLEFGSAGIGKLLVLYKNIKLRGGKLQLIKVPKEIYRAFRVTELDKLFEISMT